MAQTDREQIQDVLTRYATGIDRRDWPLFRTCFCDDIVADYGDFGRWHSGDEITATMEEIHRPLGETLHRITNFVIELQGDRATSRCYVDALLMPGEAGGDVRRGIGYYDDELTRAADGWKIHKRRFVPVHLV